VELAGSPRSVPAHRSLYLPRSSYSAEHSCRLPGGIIRDLLSVDGKGYLTGLALCLHSPYQAYAQILWYVSSSLSFIPFYTLFRSGTFNLHYSSGSDPAWLDLRYHRVPILETTPKPPRSSTLQYLLSVVLQLQKSIEYRAGVRRRERRSYTPTQVLRWRCTWMRYPHNSILAIYQACEVYIQGMFDLTFDLHTLQHFVTFLLVWNVLSFIFSPIVPSFNSSPSPYFPSSSQTHSPLPKP